MPTRSFRELAEEQRPCTVDRSTSPDRTSGGRGLTRPVGRLGAAALVLVVLASLLSVVAGAPAARAEVENPRQQWLRDATVGLFLHWGMFTAPRHLSRADWDHDVTGWCCVTGSDGTVASVGEIRGQIVSASSVNAAATGELCRTSSPSS